MGSASVWAGWYWLVARIRRESKPLVLAKERLSDHQPLFARAAAFALAGPACLAFALAFAFAFGAAAGAGSWVVHQDRAQATV